MASKVIKAATVLGVVESNVNIIKEQSTSLVKQEPIRDKVTKDVYTLPGKDQALGRLYASFAPFLNDPRDAPFLIDMAKYLMMFLPTFAYFYYFRAPLTSWRDFSLVELGWCLAHLVGVVVFLGPFILMMHCTAHSQLFKSSYGPLNKIIPWIVAPIFGSTPETYHMHHLKMHHVTGNGPEDLSSTLGFERDNFGHWLQYFLRFLFGVFYELGIFFVKRKQYSFALRAWIGEMSWFVATIYFWRINWIATMCTMVVPFLVARFGMMSGNWAQHAFVDPEDPMDDYKSSITCINTIYNRRCFNDGYHISHHLNPKRHWMDHPQHMLNNERMFLTQKAVVFEGIDYLQVWFCLMTRRYDWLADRFVKIDGDNRSKEEIMAFLKSRTRPIDVTSLRLKLEAAEAAKKAAKAKTK